MLRKADFLFFVTFSSIMWANVSALRIEGVFLRQVEKGSVPCTQKEVIFRLSEIAEARSRETGNHVRRVSEYAVLIARKCGLSDKEIELLKLTVPVHDHDIGKLAIPDSIFLKPDKLTEEEFEIIKKHTLFGYEMLCNSFRKTFKTAATIASQHHGRIDENECLQGRKDEDIHLYARIATIADVFDLLSSDRCYKKAWQWKDVVEYMKENCGKQLETRLVEYLLSEEEKVRYIQSEYVDHF